MQNKTSPIFEPLRGRYKPFGIPLAKLIGVILFVVLAAAVSMALDLWTKEADVAYTQLEKEKIYQNYNSVANVMASLEAQRVQDGFQTIEALPLSPVQQQAYNTAKELGIEADSTEEYLASIVPETYRGYVAVIPWWARIVFLIVLPFITGITLFIEPEGTRTSAWRELVRMQKFRQGQKHYKCMPVTYVEKACATPYYQALSNIEG